MDFTEIIDIADEAEQDIGRYKLEITLSPTHLQSEEYLYDDIQWQSVKYCEEEIDQVPDDRRGVYAFAISHDGQVLPPHSYILYIGIAGRDSNRSLRARYKDYFNSRKIVTRGGGMLRMFARWNEVLRFYYFPVDDDVSSDDLQLLERQLNTALLPPFSIGDLEVETKRKQRILG